MNYFVVIVVIVVIVVNFDTWYIVHRTFIYTIKFFVIDLYL